MYGIWNVYKPAHPTHNVVYINRFAPVVFRWLGCHNVCAFVGSGTIDLLSALRNNKCRGSAHLNDSKHAQLSNNNDAKQAKWGLLYSSIPFAIQFDYSFDLHYCSTGYSIVFQTCSFLEVSLDFEHYFLFMEYFKRVWSLFVTPMHLLSISQLD